MAVMPWCKDNCQKDGGAQHAAAAVGDAIVGGAFVPVIANAGNGGLDTVGDQDVGQAAVGNPGMMIILVGDLTGDANVNGAGDDGDNAAGPGGDAVGDTVLGNTVLGFINDGAGVLGDGILNNLGVELCEVGMEVEAAMATFVAEIGLPGIDCGFGTYAPLPSPLEATKLPRVSASGEVPCIKQASSYATGDWSISFSSTGFNSANGVVTAWPTNTNTPPIVGNALTPGIPPPPGSGGPSYPPNATYISNGSIAVFLTYTGVLPAPEFVNVTLTSNATANLTSGSQTPCSVAMNVSNGLGAPPSYGIPSGTCTSTNASCEGSTSVSLLLDTNTLVATYQVGPINAACFTGNGTWSSLNCTINIDVDILPAGLPIDNPVLP